MVDFLKGVFFFLIFAFYGCQWCYSLLWVLYSFYSLIAITELIQVVFAQKSFLLQRGIVLQTCLSLAHFMSTWHKVINHSDKKEKKNKLFFLIYFDMEFFWYFIYICNIINSPNDDWWFGDYEILNSYYNQN